MISVIAMATAFDGYLSQFLESCRRAGCSPTILGWGRAYTGSGLKIKLTALALRSMIGQARHVLLVDAFDSILVQDLQTILDRYRAFDHPMVIATERDCWPDKEREQMYPHADSPYRFLNAGGWIGEVDYILDLFERMNITSIEDSAHEQRLLADYFISHPSAMRLDTRCEIFQSLYLAADDLEYGKGIKNKVTGTYPCVIHGCGHADMTQAFRWSDLG